MIRSACFFVFTVALFLSACSFGDQEAPEVSDTPETTIEVIPGPTVEPEATSVEDTHVAPELNVDLSEMTETASGLYYRDLEEGSGAEAEAGDVVSMRYSGWLVDGTQFDSNADAPEPFTFQLDAGEVIPGFDEGVTGMQAGGRRQIVIPPELGYGPQGAGPIPPNAILVFNIELEDVGGE